MRITDVECHLLRVPDIHVDATDSAQDDIVVLVHTDEGITGIGETDVNPWIAQACIEARGSHTMGLGLKQMLIGENPLEPERVWEKMYVGSAMNGRRGAMICAIGAIDMALWDICGKAAGVPTWKLLGPAGRDHIVPYASLQPWGSCFAEYKDSLVAWAVRAKELGFVAGKMEVTLSGPYRHAGMQEPDERMTEVVAACRAAVGPDFIMMVDVQYTWDCVDTALRTLADWRDLGVYFVETPLRMDDLRGYARLHQEAGLRIAAGEWQNTRFEFEDLMDIGLVDVAQPDVGRVGGLTEARRVCQMAAERNRLIVPHCWKTGIGIAATAHLAAITPHCPFIEFMPAELCDSLLRKDLVRDELRIHKGVLPLPERPGLGIELNPDALRRFRA